MRSNDPSNVLAPRDKLSVFISSTISECAEERRFAELGIRGTNHDPVIFEKLGSRPHYPRDVYLSRLRQSQIVVAIYKDGYGYIDAAGGMTISGLEDEYRSALRFSIPMLVYINRDKAKRDAKLQVLLDEIMSSEQTVAFYARASELEERIKDDVTALTTQRFFDAAVQEDALADSALVAIDRSAPPGGFIERTDIMQSLRSLAVQGGVVQLIGEGGSGKTVLLSQLAATERMPLVIASNLSPKEIFGVLANHLHSERSEPMQFATYEGARYAFASAWADSGPATLLIDDSPHIQAAIEAIRDIPHRPGRAIIFSGREAIGDVPNVELATFELPPLTSQEVQQLLRNALRSDDAKAIADVLGRTQGNPLRVRQEIVAAGRSVEALWSQLAAKARELMTYLSIARSPLEVETLLALSGDASYMAEQLFNDMDALPELVVGTGNGYQIVHERIRDELYALVQRRPERLQFAARRLAKRLAGEGRVVQAYFVLARANHPDAARVLDRASFEAARSGDWKAMVELSTVALARAVERVDNEGTIHSHLALAQALEMSGRAHEAKPHLEAARAAATRVGKAVKLDIDVMLSAYNAHHKLTQSAIEDLASLRDRLEQAGRPWQAARLSLELSATYINIHQPEAAEREARSALAGFESANDEYGTALARRNLASALVLADSSSEEADRLIREVEQSDHEVGGRRSRAWLCNVMVRKNRVARQFALAEAYAREAISIGRELGDEYLVAINGIGLGNILSDQNKYGEAIDAYNAAGVSGQRCGRHEIEAHASYLAANTYNEIPEGHPLKGDAAVRAEMLARQAIGLMRDTVADDHLGRAFEALSDALFAQRRRQEAVDALFTGASFHFRRQDRDSFERLFMTACYNAEDLPKSYLRGIYIALGMERHSAESGTRLELFYRPISDAVRALPHETILPFVGHHLRMMTDGLPPRIVRRVVDLVLRDVKSVAAESPDGQLRFLYSTLMLATGCAASLTNQDYLRIAEAVSDLTPGVYAKPERDGGAIWTVELSMPTPIAITLAPMDDSAATTLACLQLALFLKGFEADLSRDLLGGIALLSELTIMVAFVEKMPEDLKHSVLPHLVDVPCCVTRLTPGPDDDSAVPTSVFLSKDYMIGLTVGAGRGGSFQALVGLTLNEVVYRLLRGTVDLETLRPKLVRLVRRSIS